MPGPLQGVRVLDLSVMISGPLATMILADQGAEVIKVESPGLGDIMRFLGTSRGGMTGIFANTNRGKRSLVLDLKQPAGLDVLTRLVAQSDVFIQNFRPGAMDRLGLGWNALEARCPQLIYAATSGFGQTGPYSERPAYDVIAQAMGGIMSLTGHEGGPPTRVGASIGDLGAGLFTALGIVAALHDRTRTGQGMLIDVAMLDSQIGLLENAIIRYFASGQSPKPAGARHSSIAPFEPYHARNGYIVIACGNDELFRRMAACLRRPDLAADPRFSENARRSDNVLALKDALETILQAHDVEHWLEVLGAAGIPCAPINDVAHACADPQVAARNMIVPIDDAALPGIKVAGLPIKMSAYADRDRRDAAPELDADRARILADFPDS
jgi:CoA:oxalate CoA-transferase